MPFLKLYKKYGKKKKKINLKFRKSALKNKLIGIHAFEKKNVKKKLKN